MRNDDAAAIKDALLDPKLVCEALGLEMSPERQRAGVLAWCPWHGEKSASCSITVGPAGTLRAHCFGCKAGGDVLALIAAARGLDIRRDFRAVLREGASIAGITLDESPGPSSPSTPRAPRPAAPAFGSRGPAIVPLADELFADILSPVLAAGVTAHRDAAAYLASRGLLEDAIADGWGALPGLGPARAAWLRMLIDGFAEPDLVATGLLRRSEGGLEIVRPLHRLVIPWRSPAGLVCTVQRRRIDPGDPKYVAPAGRAPRWPYGIERLAGTSSATPIAFTEGAIDALALRRLDARAGFDRVVMGVPGIDGWRRAWAPLVVGRIVSIATDADAAGDRVVDAWAADLYDAGALDVQRLRPVGGKDWADVLLSLTTGAR